MLSLSIILTLLSLYCHIQRDGEYWKMSRQECSKLAYLPNY